MTLRTSLSLAPALVLAMVVPALAQQPSAPVGIYISANGGASFDTQVDPAASFGVEVGDNINRNSQAYLSISYFENLMSTDLRDDLSLLSDTLSVVTGRTWDIQGRDRGVSLIAGGKYLFGDGGSTGAYVGGGAGVLRIKRRITEAIVGDVTSAVLRDFSIGDSSLASQSLNRPIVEGAIGYVTELGKARFDVGYRYRRAFHLGETVDFSTVTIGFGVNF